MDFGAHAESGTRSSLANPAQQALGEPMASAFWQTLNGTQDEPPLECQDTCCVPGRHGRAETFVILTSKEGVLKIICAIGPARVGSTCRPRDSENLRYSHRDASAVRDQYMADNNFRRDYSWPDNVRQSPFALAIERIATPGQIPLPLGRDPVAGAGIHTLEKVGKHHS